MTHLKFMLAGWLALVPLGTSASAQQPEALLRVLTSHQRGEHSQAEVARAMASLRPNPVPLLFEMHRHGPEVFFQGEQIDASKYWCTPDLFSGLALEALVRCPPELVVSHGSGRLASAADLGERLTLVRVLGRLESSAGLPLLIEILDGLSEAELGSFVVRRAWQDAMGSMLALDPGSAEPLLQAARRMPPHRVELLVHGALAAEHPRAIELLVSLMELDAGLDLLILRHLVSLQSRFPWHEDERVGHSVMQAMGQSNLALQREAARAAGELRLVPAAAALIQRLESPDAALGRLALDSLKQLSGNRYQRADADWASWLSAELAWWEAESEPLFSALFADEAQAPSDQEAQASPRFDALRKLARHPLHAHAIARRISGELSSMRPELAQHAMELLGVLDSKVAYPELIQELDASEASRRLSAHQALVRLSGQDLEPRRELWEPFARY